mmetsp:Transcript_16796/g.49427  ORF Transcript_16796/g.49427 Transcript_16796/m.49427 type:complete len:100 (+) Transcript_16796:120-419(+)
MPIDYSRWSKIDISDDEDDTHPNVDTASLFKWRHEARLKKEADKKDEDAKKNAQSKLRVKKGGVHAGYPVCARGSGSHTALALRSCSGGTEEENRRTRG